MNKKEEVKFFLENNYLASLSTISSEGEPQVAVVLYYTDKDFNLYFVTREHTRKAVNLKTNTKVGLAVGNDRFPGTVQLQGEADSRPEYMREFVEKLGERKDLNDFYSGPFLKVRGIDFQAFKVRPSWLRYTSLNPASGMEEQLQII